MQSKRTDREEEAARIKNPRFSRFTRIAQRLEKLLPNREEQEARDEQKASRARGTTPVAQLEQRGRVSVFGVLRSVTYPAQRSAASFSATLFDGTGSIEVVWSGRKKVRGIEPGIHVYVQGTVTRLGGTLCIMNPSYQIVPQV